MWVLKRFDFMPLFIAMVLAFVAISTVQFSHAWPDAQHGLLLYEKTCPLNYVNAQ